MAQQLKETCGQERSSDVLNHFSSLWAGGIHKIGTDIDGRNVEGVGGLRCGWHVA